MCWGQRAVPGRRSSSGFSMRDLPPEVEPKLKMSRKVLADLRLDVEAYDIKKVSYKNGDNNTYFRDYHEEE